MVVKVSPFGGIFFGHDCIHNAMATIGKNLHAKHHGVCYLHGMPECFGNIHTQDRDEETIWVLPTGTRLVYSLGNDLIHIPVKVLHILVKATRAGISL